MKPQNPIIKRDKDIGWEVMVPPDLLPVTLRCVSISPEGLYIETKDEAWDMIPFQDLADLVDIGSRTLDEQIDIDLSDHTRSLIAKLTCPIVVAAGQPRDHRDSMPTGQERAYRRWDADQPYEFTYPGGQ